MKIYKRNKNNKLVIYKTYKKWEIKWNTKNKSKQMMPFNKWNAQILWKRAKVSVEEIKIILKSFFLKLVYKKCLK